MKVSGIYTITNVITNKIYVGKSIELNVRLAQHRSDLKRNRHSNIHLQKAINQYGIDTFKFEILEECNESLLYSQENYWCNLLNTHNRDFGYNIDPTNPDGIHRLSESTKQLISSIKKEQYKDPSKNPFFNRKHRQESKDKIGLSHKGKRKKPWSLQTRNKILNSRKMATRQQVINIKTGEIYKTIKEACEKNNISRSTLTNYLSGKTLGNRKKSNKTNLKLFKCKDLI